MPDRRCENNPISRRRMLKLTAGTAAGLLMGSHESVARSQLPPDAATDPTDPGHSRTVGRVGPST